MSNEVDKRIIEMEFRNEEFEKNANKTLSTLQALKDKLNSSFSTRAAEDLNHSIKSVDISPISKGIETVQLQFGALQIAGKRVIENIVDAAMNGIHNITNKLSSVVNQIKVGGANRAQNIEQAKFMLSGLGIEWADIVDDINYGVQDTAYGLDAAAKVASQLVASNVTLGKDMQSSLRAVSGVAAMTNSTYEEIGHIFTSIAGQGRLMSMQLQQFSLRGLNVAADLAKAMNTTEAEIRDMVKKGKIDFQTFANAMDELYGEHAKEANKTFSGALSNTKAALSRLGADIQSQKFETFRIILLEVTAKLKELKKAIKPVEDSIITLTSSVGNLVAKFVKAIDIKGLVDRITPSLTKITNAMTEFIDAYSMIFGANSEIHTANDAAFFAEQKALGKLKEETIEAKEAIIDLTEITPEQVEKAHAIWDEGTYGNGIDRVRALGEEYGIVQAYVEKMIELGWDEAKMQEYLTEQTKKKEEEAEKEVKANKRIQQAIKFQQILQNLKTTIKNVFGSIGNILKVAFSSLNNAFSGKTVLDSIVSFTGKIADLSTKLYISRERAEKLRPVFEALFTVLRAAGTVVSAVGKALGNVIVFLSKLILKIKESKLINGVIDAIANAIKGIINGIGKLYDKLKETGALDKFIDILKTIGTWVGERLIDGFNKLGDIASSIGDILTGAWDKVANKVKDMGDNAERGHGWLSKIKDFFKEDIINGSWLEKLKSVLTDIFGEGTDVFTRSFTMASDLVNGIISGIKNIDQDDIDYILKIVSSVALMWSGVKFLWSLTNVNKSVETMNKALTKIFSSIGLTIKKYGKKADAERFQIFAKSVAIIIGSIIAMATAYAALEHFGFDPQKVLLISAGIVAVMSIIVGTIMVFTTYFTKAQGSIDNHGKYINILGNTKLPVFALTLISIAIFIKTMLSAIFDVYEVLTSKKYNSKMFLEVAGVLTLIVIGLSIFTGILAKTAKNTVGFTGVAFTIISIGLMLKMMVSSFKTLLYLIKGKDSDDIEMAVDVLKSLLTPILIFAGVIALINKIPTKVEKNTNPFKGMLGMFIGLAVLVRLGLVPLLKTLVDVRSQGKAGEAAVEDLKKLVNTLLIFIGAVALIMGILDRVVSFDGKNYGSQFVDGKYIGDVKSGGMRTFSKNSSMMALIGVVAAIAAMFYTLSIVMKNMKGIDKGTIGVFKDMMVWILAIVGIMSAIAGVAGAVSGNTVTFALLALAAVIVSLAAALLAAGYGFKAFETGLREFVGSLPSMIDSLLEFFAKVKNNKQDLIDGFATFISTAVEGFFQGLLAFNGTLILMIPEIVDAFVDTFVVVLNSFSRTLTEKGPEVVDAIDNLITAFTYLITYAFEKAWDKAKEHIKSKSANEWWNDFADIINADFSLKMGKKINVIPKVSVVGKGPSVDDYAAEVLNHTADIEKEKAELQRKYTKDNTEALALENYVDTDELNLLDNKLVQRMFGDKIDILKKYSDPSIIESAISQNMNDLNFENILGGDYSSILDSQGYNMGSIDMDGFIEAVKEGGPEAGQAYLEMYDGLGDINFEYAEDMSDYATQGLSNYENAIKENKEKVVTTNIEVQEDCLEAIRNYRPYYFQEGQYMTLGIAQGVADGLGISEACNNIADVVAAMQKRVEDDAEIESPSKKFMELGKYMTLGLANGVRNSINAATSASHDAGEAAILSMRETLKRLSIEAIESMDTSPRITPILDMSNVTEGISEMNKMIDTSKAVQLGLATSTEARSANNRRISSIYQNGSNYDDTNAIGAINSLQSEVSTLKDAINGMQVVIDGRALVGQIATPMDKALGKKVLAGRRGI